MKVLFIIVLWEDVFRTTEITCFDWGLSFQILICWYFFDMSLFELFSLIYLESRNQLTFNWHDVPVLFGRVFSRHSEKKATSAGCGEICSSCFFLTFFTDCDVLKPKLEVLLPILISLESVRVSLQLKTKNCDW